MAAPRTAGIRAALALCGLAALLALAGCDREAGGSGEPGRVYVVRGQIRQLPDPANPGGGFVVAHEAIDHFVGREGKEVGMDPMTMSFPVDKGISLAEFQVNDVVQMALRVNWSAEPAVRVVELQKLAPDTRLDFRAARPKPSP